MTTHSLTMPAARTRATPNGWWTPNGLPPASGERALCEALRRLGEPFQVVALDTDRAVARGGVVRWGEAFSSDSATATAAFPVLATIPSLRPENLGDPGFRRDHGLKYAYIAGAMADGITSTRMVEAMARGGCISFFGAAGLEPAEVEAAIRTLQDSLGDLPFGFNFIHSPNEPELEARLCELYLRHGVRRVSASAFLGLTLPLVRYRLAGIHRDADGQVVTPNHVFAKVSRVEVARRFFSPPPEDMVRALVQSRDLTPEQAAMAETIPVAQDLTAEADSGGHTDNRPAITLLPTMQALRDEMQAKHGYARRLRVGLGGGIATPTSAAAAFAMGAAWILTGTINQSCVEAGTSDAVREMLARAGQADVTMAPAADMFEMGVQVQVLKWGTMFPMRARKLYELYRAHSGLDDIPTATRSALERDFFHCTLAEAWDQTRRFFETRDPSQIERGERDPKHKMALVFRSYLGRSSGWAKSGDPARRADYQIWCGPAIGAFNEWARGSFLEQPDNRDVLTVAMNLLVGAAALTRASWLRAQGVEVPPEAERFAPRTPDDLKDLL